MKTLSLFAGVLMVSALPVHSAQTLYKDYPADVMPALSESGEHLVGVKTLEVTYPEPSLAIDGSMKKRSLTLEVWYPADAKSETAIYSDETRSGQVFEIEADAFRDANIKSSANGYPVVVISHGYTGYRTIMYYLGEHLASHGYVVAAIDHTDSTNKEVNFAESPFSGFPSTLLNRSRDQVFTLNAVAEHNFFSSHVDASKAGVIGYSMGGFGAVSTVGGCYAFSSEAAAMFTGVKEPAVVEQMQAALNTCAGGNASTDDVLPAWKAALALAPWGGQHQLFSTESLANIKVPTLYIAGDNDDISGYDGIRWLFENTGNTHSKLLTVKNARHNIAPHPAPAEAYGNEFDIGSYLEPAWDNQKLNAINEHFALALMNCHIKDIAEACDYLAVEGSSDQTPVNGKAPEPWYGFDNRWALGLQMESKEAK